jgi:hypothetical protein
VMEVLAVTIGHLRLAFEAFSRVLIAGLLS